MCDINVKITKIIHYLMKIPWIENSDKKELRSFINDWDINIFKNENENELTVKCKHKRLDCEFYFETDYVKYDDFRRIKIEDLLIEECGII